MFGLDFKNLGVAAACIAAGCLLHSEAHALVIVRQDGGGNAITITAGLGLASAGEEVRVTDGLNYVESVALGDNRLTSVPPGAQITSNPPPLSLSGVGTPQVEGFVINGTGALAVLINKFDPTTTTLKNCTIHATSGRTLNISMFSGGAGSVLLDSCALTGANGPLIDGSASARLRADNTNTTCTVTGWNVTVPFTLNLNNSQLDGPSVTGLQLNAQPGTANLNGCKLFATGTLGSIGIYLTTDNVTLHVRNSRIERQDYGILRAGNDINLPCAITVDGNSTFTQSGTEAIRLFEPSILNMSDTVIGNSAAAHGLHVFNAGESTIALDNVKFTANGKSAVYGEVPVGPGGTGSTWSISRTRFENCGETALLLDSAQSTGVLVNVSRCWFTATSNGSNPHVKLTRVGASFTNTLFDHGANPIFQTFLAGGELVKLVHCAFVTASSQVCFDVNTAGTLYVRNSVIDMPGGGAYVVNSGSVSDDYNLVRGNVFGTTLGTHSSTANPLFTTASTGPGTGNFHLQAGSPGNGAGAQGLGVNVDYDGNTRPNPALTDPDLGIYETAAVPVELALFSIE